MMNVDTAINFARRCAALRGGVDQDFKHPNDADGLRQHLKVGVMLPKFDTMSHGELLEWLRTLLGANSHVTFSPFEIFLVALLISVRSNRLWAVSGRKSLSTDVFDCNPFASCGDVWKRFNQMVVGLSEGEINFIFEQSVLRLYRANLVTIRYAGKADVPSCDKQGKVKRKRIPQRNFGSRIQCIVLSHDRSERAASSQEVSEAAKEFAADISAWEKTKGLTEEVGD